MLIGTPGRVWEFVYLKKWIDFLEVRLVIIDDADCTFVGSFLTHCDIRLFWLVSDTSYVEKY